VATALLVAGSTPTVWIPQFLSTSSYSSVVQALGCSHNCRWLAFLIPINAHVMWWCCSIELIEPWGQNEDRTLLQHTQRCHNSEFRHVRKHQCTTAIITMWTESSWTFPESYTADDSWIVRSRDGGHRETKGLITPPPRWVSAQLLYVCVIAW